MRVATSVSSVSASSRNSRIDFSESALAQVVFRELGLSPRARFTLAFSGGLDSHVLLHALARLRDAHGLDLTAVHVHHGLQTEADRWTEHCARVCERLAVSFVVEHVDVPKTDAGVEAAAREARYVALGQHVGDEGVLLTAHQQDDQAETVLLQLLRGSGVAGIAAMPGLDRFGRGWLARPLLGFTRGALAEYGRTHGLVWIEDPMNLDPHYARTFIRGQVLPLLTQRWPQVTTVLARNARQAAEALAVLEELAQMDLAAALHDENKLQIPPLLPLSPARLRNALRYWFKRNHFKTPSALHLSEVEQLVRIPTRSRQGLLKWPGAEVRRYRDTLFLLEPSGIVPTYCHAWQVSSPLALPEIGRVLSVSEAEGKGLSRERIKGQDVLVRSRAGGEHCQLPGRGTHELRKLFQEAAVPPWERERVPLVFVSGRLAAVGERWVCEPYAAQAGEAGWTLNLKPMQ